MRGLVGIAMAGLALLSQPTMVHAAEGRGEPRLERLGGWEVQAEATGSHRMGLSGGNSLQLPGLRKCRINLRRPRIRQPTTSDVGAQGYWRDQPLEVPLRTDLDGRLRVDVVFEDGDQYEFIIDTGAMNSFILPALVEARGLRAIPREEAKATDVMMGFTPYASQDILVGGVVAYTLDRPGALQGLTISEDEVYGVLGEDFLSRYAVELDPGRGVMRLAPTADALMDDRNFTSVGLEELFPGMGLRTVQTQIADQPVRAFLDTGAGKTLINSILYEMVRDRHVLRVGESQSVRGSHGPAQQATNVVLDALSLGSRVWSVAEVLVSDGIFQQLQMMDGPAVLLGANLLHDGPAFIVDYAGGLLWAQVDEVPEDEPGH